MGRKAQIGAGVVWRVHSVSRKAGRKILCLEIQLKGAALSGLMLKQRREIQTSNHKVRDPNVRHHRAKSQTSPREESDIAARRVRHHSRRHPPPAVRQDHNLPPDTMSVSLPSCVTACLLFFLLPGACLRAGLFACLFVCRSSCSARLLACCLPACSPACLPCLFSCLLACFVPGRWLVSVLSCLCVCLPACRPVGI